jgi:hypothetical protein
MYISYTNRKDLALPDPIMQLRLDDSGTFDSVQEDATVDACRKCGTILFVCTGQNRPYRTTPVPSTCDLFHGRDKKWHEKPQHCR